MRPSHCLLAKIVIAIALPAALAVACGSSSGDAGLFTPSASGCLPNTDSVQKTLFVPKCANAGCHSASSPQADLDLASPGVEARLVGTAATQCANQTIVVAGNPSGSYLLAKLGTKPSCGSAMPLGGGTLDPSDVACVIHWIESLKANSGDGGQTGDTGTVTACNPGLLACGTACVDTKTDQKNCGTCGNTCPVACSNGACVASCSAPTTNCSGSCVDTNTSATNCGACGKACTAGKVCVAGACSCGASVATLSAIQSQIFTPTCATSQCHAPTKVGPNLLPAQAGLDLRAGSSFSNLVNVPSSACGATLRVAPGNVGSSYLMNKLMGVGMCTGSQMPKKGTSLPAAQLDMVRSWICSGAANN